MKKQYISQCITSFLILVLILFLVTSCQTMIEESESYCFSISLPDSLDASQVSQQSFNSCEESLNQWVETQTIGQTQVTREYYDGEKDYVVTEIHNSEEGVSRKRVRHFVNKEIVFDEISEFGEKGVLLSKQTKTIEHETQYYESFERLSSLLKSKEGQLDDNGGFQGRILYTNFEERIIAEGTQDCEIIKGTSCIVEKLTVFDPKGEVDHYEVRILGSNVRYSYREYADASNTIIWSQEIDGQSECVKLGGSTGGTCKSTDNEAHFYDRHDQLIGKCELRGDQLELVELGSKYNVESAVQRIREWQKEVAEIIRLDEMVLQSR